MGNYLSYVYSLESNTESNIEISDEQYLVSEMENYNTNVLVPIKKRYKKTPDLEWDYDGIDIVPEIDYREKYNRELKKNEIINDKYILLLYKFNCLLKKKND